MLAAELITDEVPPLKVTDTGEKALKWMDEFKVYHLPVVDGTEYVGLISDSMILDLNEPDKPVGEFRQGMVQMAVKANQHIYDVMKLIADHNLSIVPILDAEDKYLGLTSVPVLMKLITNTASISETGGIIVLELNTNDYSLAEIAQIVEGNDAKILSCYTTSAADSTKLEITLKINRKDLGGILQTFNRYDYIVSASYQKGDGNDDLKDRYDSLMNYLNL